MKKFTAACLIMMELMVDQTAQSFSPLRHGSRRRSMQYSMSPKKTSYAVQVTYEGRSCTIAVEPGETILAAMERTGVSDPLCLPLLPQDCRRGNCLTCTGRHGPGSQPQSLASIGDGLSPHMSDQVSLAGYVLTCCATVTGPGVHLTLGENEGAWRMMHQTRLRDDEAKRVHQESVARVMTLRAERNVPRWAKETEDVLKKTPEL